MKTRGTDDICATSFDPANATGVQDGWSNRALRPSDDFFPSENCVKVAASPAGNGFPNAKAEKEEIGFGLKRQVIKWQLIRSKHDLATVIYS